jgi:hypothetical protein
MKTLLIIILLLLTGTAYTQTKRDKILIFAESKLGKRVKSGDCYQFVEAAVKSADRSFDSSFRNKIPMDSAVAGDIVKFSGCKFADGGRAASHWGIVVHVEDSVITLYHQNVDVSDLKDSKVILSDLSMKGMIKPGKIIFYRIE